MMKKAKNVPIALAYLIILAIISTLALVYKSVLLGLFHIASFFDTRGDWNEFIEAMHAL